MSHHLDSLLASMDHLVALVDHVILYCLISGFLAVLFGLIEDASVTAEGDMLPDFDIFLGPLQLFELFFEVFNQIFS